MDSSKVLYPTVERPSYRMSHRARGAEFTVGLSWQARGPTGTLLACMMLDIARIARGGSFYLVSYLILSYQNVNKDNITLI